MMSVLPGTVVNGCEIKMYAVCPNADLRGLTSGESTSAGQI